MLILGITGGVGSGKSRILNELRDHHGAYIVETDSLAHKLMEPGEEVYDQIVSEFGRDILHEKEPFFIDRPKFAEIVFRNKSKLEKLNKIVHPAVKRWIVQDIESKKQEGILIYVIEAALLIQDGYQSICDEIWYIYVSKEERTKRLIAQRGYTPERCEAMFNSQDTEEYYKKYADFTINNELDFDNSTKQLNDRLNKLLPDDII